MTKCKTWKIQARNRAHGRWKDYKAGGLFELKSVAEAELRRMRGISGFDGRVVPVGAREEPL